MKKNRTGRIFSSIYGILVFIFMYAPIAVLIVFSFNTLKSRGKWGGFTFEWYRELFKDSTIMSSLSTTLTVALIASSVAVIIGTLAAVGMFFMNKRMRKIHMNMTYLPVLNADIVTGIALLSIFAVLGVKLGYMSLLLAHITFNIPYVILSVLPKLRQMEWHTYEAALDLGAHPLKAFQKAVLPDLMPGVVTGFLLAFTLSIDDFVISYFTAGAGVSTLSVTIYSMARKGIKPEINALSALLFVTVLTLLLIINFRSNREKKTIRASESDGNIDVDKTRKG